MLNLQDNLKPREIERGLREYQKRQGLSPYFPSQCMDALATSKDGYIVYSTDEHPAGARGAVSTSSARYFANRREAEDVLEREKSRPGVVLAHVIETDQELWKLVNAVHHGLDRASRAVRTVEVAIRSVEASMEERLKAVEERIQRLSDLIDADAIERRLNDDEGEKHEMANDPLTREAREILQAAAANADGDIMYVRTMGRPGVHIQAGDQEMIPDDADNRTIQRWIGGLEDLEAAGYIRPTGTSGECFEVTREGYAAADRPSGGAGDQV